MDTFAVLLPYVASYIIAGLVVARRNVSKKPAVSTYRKIFILNVAVWPFVLFVNLVVKVFYR